MASRDPNAIVGFGGDVSPQLLENLSLTNDGIARELTAVRKIYGSLGMTSADLELTLAARTVDAYAAKNLGDTVEGLKQLAGLFIGRLSPVKSALARTALSNLKITTHRKRASTENCCSAIAGDSADEGILRGRTTDDGRPPAKSK